METRPTSNSSRRAARKRIAKALRGSRKPDPSPKSMPTSNVWRVCLRCGRFGLCNMEGICTGQRFVMTADSAQRYEDRSQRCDFIVDSMERRRVASPSYTPTPTTQEVMQHANQ